VQVTGDVLRLTQALTNILNNAVRYTEPGGRISVRLGVKDADRGRVAALSVRDSGRGIEPDMLQAIFGMFVQGHDPARHGKEGLGVGLALARSIVELHHGTLDAESEGSGRGSKFVIRLPALATAQTVAPQPEVAWPAVPSVRRRVLVVDDNADAAQTLATLLRQLGHDVQIAGGGEEALRIATGYRPEVILMDLGMPGMNGLETARRLRQSGTTPAPYIIAVTGWGKPEDMALTREAGFDQHLMKPVDERRLVDLIGGHAAARLH
jgi:CheY-like chemotaxis protein